MEEVFIVDMKRCAFTRGGRGLLVASRLDELAVTIIEDLMRSNPKIGLENIDEVGLGQVGQAGEFLNMGSAQIAQLAGIPYEASKFESNRQCGSSMEVLQRMTHNIMLGMYDIGLCLGAERMERTLSWPMKNTTRITKINPKLFQHHNDIQKKQAASHRNYFKTDIPNEICNSPPLCSMIQTGQNVADMYQLQREELDEFAYFSHQKYKKALASGFYNHEITELTLKEPIFDENGHCDHTKIGKDCVLKVDDGYRESCTIEKLSSLNPIPGVHSYLKNDIIMTAGNSCPTNDGISACLIMSAKKAKALGIKPLARIKAMTVSGIKPQIMGVGPVISTKKALKMANIDIKDIDLVEFNEAFASQVIASAKEMGIEKDKININGGSLAIGHPLGATGIRLVGTLAKSLNFHGKKVGIATQCIGAGMGITTVIEAIE